MTLSLQLLWNYWSIYHETWYVDRTLYGVMHIGRKFWSPYFCGSYAPWNLENICKSTNNLSFWCQFFINEITASDAGPDIIRSHLFMKNWFLMQRKVNYYHIFDIKTKAMLMILSLCIHADCSHLVQTGLVVRTALSVVEKNPTSAKNSSCKFSVKQMYRTMKDIISAKESLILCSTLCRQSGKTTCSLNQSTAFQAIGKSPSTEENSSIEYKWSK